MDDIETIHHKKMIVAETMGFKFQADLFKSVPMIIGWRPWTTLKPFTFIKWLLKRQLVSDSKQTSSNYCRLSMPIAVMDNIETVHNKNMVVAETVGFRFEAFLFKSVLMIL